MKVAHDVLVRDSAFFSASWPRSPFRRQLLTPATSFRLMQQLEQPISSQPSMLLPSLPVADCVLIRPASLAPLADVFQVAGFSLSTSSVSWLSSSWRRTANVKVGFRVNDKISPMSRPSLATSQHGGTDGGMGHYRAPNQTACRQACPRDAREVVLLNQPERLNSRFINCRRDSEPLIGLVICDCRLGIGAENPVDRPGIISLVVQFDLNVCDDFVWRQIVIAIDRPIVGIISVGVVSPGRIPIARIKVEWERLGKDGNENDPVAMVFPPTATVPLGLVIAKNPILSSGKRVTSPVVAEGRTPFFRNCRSCRSRPIHERTSRLSFKVSR